MSIESVPPGFTATVAVRAGAFGAAVMLICVTGLISPLLHVIPLEVVAIVIVWFGLVMVAQAFQEIPKSHCIAVAFGLLPMLASWTWRANSASRMFFFRPGNSGPSSNRR